LEQFELSDFFLPETENRMPSLGAVVILNKIAVSFRSASCWKFTEIKLVQRRLRKNGELTDHHCLAKNCSTAEHWEQHFRGIAEQRKKNCRKGQIFWGNRQAEFPNLIFCKQSKKKF